MGFLLKRQTYVLNWLRADVKDFSKKAAFEHATSKCYLDEAEKHAE
jgi:hypothetical protein